MLPEHEHTEFINKIVQDADLGYSFAPFIGSGLSSPSGIIMGVEFTNYLAFTTYLVLADPTDRPKTHGENESHRWNISKKGWPPLPTKDEVDLARNGSINALSNYANNFNWTWPTMRADRRESKA